MITGRGAPPRANGELVFAAPWESRAFGVAIALHESGALDFEQFRAALIEEIGAADDGAYYERWQAALERVVVSGGVVSPRELDARAAALAHEWSHDHEH